MICYSSFLYILITVYLADGDATRFHPRSSIGPSNSLESDSNVEIENLNEKNRRDTAVVTNNLYNLASELTIIPLCTLSRPRFPKTGVGGLDVFIVLPKGALDHENSVRAELEDADKLAVIFFSPLIPFEAEK